MKHNKTHAHTATFRVTEHTLDQVKYMAYHENSTQGQILVKAVNLYLETEFVKPVKRKWET